MYNTLTRNWILKPERLPFPVYEHGCIVTISKITGKQIILLAGGLKGGTVKLPLFNGEFVELPTHEEMVINWKSEIITYINTYHFRSIPIFLIQMRKPLVGKF